MTRLTHKGLPRISTFSVSLKARKSRESCDVITAVDLPTSSISHAEYTVTTAWGRLALLVFMGGVACGWHSCWGLPLIISASFDLQRQRSRFSDTQLLRLGISTTSFQILAIVHKDLCVGKLSMINPAIEIQNLQFCLFIMTTRAELGCPMKYSSDFPLYSVSYVWSH